MSARLLQLVDVAERLGGDEFELLLIIARRLDAGRTRYGALDVTRDARDFRAEALEELADAAVYLAADLLRSHRGPAPVSGPPNGHRVDALPCGSPARRCVSCGSALAGGRRDRRYCDGHCRAAARDARRGKSLGPVRLARLRARAASATGPDLGADG